MKHELDALARRLGGGTPVALVTADLEGRIVAVELPSGRHLRTPHSFSLRKSPTAVGTSPRLRLTMKGRLRAKRKRSVFVTVKAGGRPVVGAKVRAFGGGVITKWRKTTGPAV